MSSRPSPHCSPPSPPTSARSRGVSDADVDLFPLGLATGVGEREEVVAHRDRFLFIPLRPIRGVPHCLQAFVLDQGGVILPVILSSTSTGAFRTLRLLTLSALIERKLSHGHLHWKKHQPTAGP